MLVLALADFNATREMGPMLALGVAVMLLAGLTLLPALLAALGRRAFWPARPGVRRRAQGRPHELLGPHRPPRARPPGAGARHRGRDPRRSARSATSAGASNLDFAEGFTTDPDSEIGQAVIDETLSPGQSAATDIVTGVEAEQPVLAALRRDQNVEAARGDRPGL